MKAQDFRIMRLVKLVVPIFCVLLLSGCLAGSLVGIAASAGGSYIASKELGKARDKQKAAQQKQFRREYLAERTKWEKERSKAFSSDQRINANLDSRFIGGGLTKLLIVKSSVKDGVVTLTGNVPSKTVLDRAISIARSMPGVKQVKSQLVVREVKVLSVAPPPNAQPRRAGPRPGPRAVPPGRLPPRGARTAPPRRAPSTGTPNTRPRALPPRTLERPAPSRPPRRAPPPNISGNPRAVPPTLPTSRFENPDKLRNSN